MTTRASTDGVATPAPPGHVEGGEAVSGLVTRRVPVISPDQSLGVIRSTIRGHRYDSVRDLPVCHADGRLIGLVRIEDVLAGAADTPVRSVMDPEPPALDERTSQEVAAWHAVRHRESNLVLVDRDGRFSGVVPADRLLEVLLHEHEQDVARLGGYLASTEPARHAATESVTQRLAHRIPWLLVGLAGALAAAGLMTGFEERLRAEVTLALFIPGVVYLADAVGTQTEALVIRSLSVGVRLRQIVGRELVTGLAAGLILALVFLPVGLAIWGGPPVITAVAVAIFAACTVANAVAMALPALFDRFGIDPAFGSGPLATVIQDLLTIAIYLGVALLLIGR
jgi:magnesium transporter